MSRMFELDPKICAICGGETKDSVDVTFDKICINGCVEFLITEDYKVYGVMVNFDEKDYRLNFPEDAQFYPLPKRMKELRERIEYWKENDRYLMKILER